MIRLTALLVAVMAIAATMTDENSSANSTAKTASNTAAEQSAAIETAAADETLLPPEPAPLEQASTLSVTHGEGVTIREYARSDSPMYLRKMVSVQSSDAPAEARIIQASASGDAQSRIFQVSGNVVNLRSGPSTSNGVVASQTRGTEVEVLSHHGGWAELVVLDSAEVGFMSASFLQAVN